MSYVIVAKGTGLIVTDGPNKTRAYKTFPAAAATRTRLCHHTFRIVFYSHVFR